MAADYERTRITALHIENYRSIRELQLNDIPDLVVLHGRNGSGKSNVLGAVSLALRLLGSNLPVGEEQAGAFTSQTMRASYFIEPDDFYWKSSRMRLELTLRLGTRVQEGIAPNGVSLRSLRFAIVVQRVGTEYRIWFDQLLLNGRVDLLLSRSARKDALGRELDALTAKVTTLQATRAVIKESNGIFRSPTIADIDDPRVDSMQDFLPAPTELNEATDTLQAKNAELAENEAIPPDFRRPFTQYLSAHLHGLAEEYRYIPKEPLPEQLKGPELAGYEKGQIQRLLYEWRTSRNNARRDRVVAFSTRLERVGLNGKDPIKLEPVLDRDKNEYILLLTRAGGVEVPLQKLGTGEQQLFVMMAQLFLAARPVMQIEEPEAHLHHETMKHLARELRALVSPEDGAAPEVDQLWIATHHHRFALAPKFYDVTYDQEHGTTVTQKDRREAANHFYEPGPLWEVFRTLAHNSLRDDTVVFWDKDGNPVTTKALADAIEHEDPVAKEWAAALTEFMILSMKKRDTAKQQGDQAKETTTK